MSHSICNPRLWERKVKLRISSLIQFSWIGWYNEFWARSLHLFLCVGCSLDRVGFALVLAAVCCVWKISGDWTGDAQLLLFAMEPSSSRFLYTGKSARITRCIIPGSCMEHATVLTKHGAWVLLAANLALLLGWAVMLWTAGIYAQGQRRQQLLAPMKRDQNWWYSGPEIWTEAAIFFCYPTKEVYHKGEHLEQDLSYHQRPFILETCVTEPCMTSVTRWTFLKRAWCLRIIKRI